MVNSKYRLFKGVSDISYFFRKKRENGLSVYYISIVLLTEGETVDTLVEFNKSITIKLNVWKANIRFESQSYFGLY